MADPVNEKLITLTEADKLVIDLRVERFLDECLPKILEKAFENHVVVCPVGRELRDSKKFVAGVIAACGIIFGAVGAALGWIFK